MVIPDPGKGANVGPAPPPGVYNPYKALIEALPLSDEVVALLKPAFTLKGFDLVLDPTGLTDFGNNPLPHYRVDTENGKVFLIHLAEDVAGNASGQTRLLTLASSFLNTQPCALFVFSEVDSFAFEPENIIDAWQVVLPNLKVRFVSLPLIQQLKLETNDDKRIPVVNGLLYLDALLVGNQKTLEAQIESAYKQARLDLLANLKGLPERLNDADRKYVIDFIAQLAIGPPLLDPKKYLYGLVSKLGLEIKETTYILGTFNGNASNDSEGLLMWLEERTYPNGIVQGYKRVLGYMLSLLADEGGGRAIALIIFKYRLVASTLTLQALVAKYP